MPEQTEQIVLEVEEAPAIEGAKRANAALEVVEKTGTRATETLGKGFTHSGEVIVRAMDRSRASAERLVASIEKRAAVAGKTGVERLIAERDQLIQRLAGEERAIARARAAYDKLITAQRQAEHETRSLGENLQKFARNPLQATSSAITAVIGGLGRFGTAAIAAAAAVGVAAKAAVNLVYHLGAGADQMANMAERTGLSVNQIDKLQAMAKIADVNIGALETGARALAEGLTDLGTGGHRAREALAQVGVQVYDAGGRQREMGQVMLDLLKKLGAVESQAERVALANAALGRGAIELLPLVRNFDALEREVTRLGFGLDEYLLRRLGAGSDGIDKLGLRWELLKRKLAEPALAVVDVIVRITETLLAPRAPDVPARQEDRIHFSVEPERRRRELMAAAAMAADRDIERQRRRDLAEQFQRERSRTVEGMRQRLHEIEEERRPIEAALLSGNLAREAFAHKRGDLAALDREKAAIEERIKAMEDARRDAEQKAKLAEKVRAEIDQYKQRIALAAAGASLEIVAPEKNVAAASERRLAFESRRFEEALAAERNQLQDESRELEKRLDEAKRAEERLKAHQVGSLEREARLEEQLIRLRTGPGGERQAIEETYHLRVEYAQREFSIHQNRLRLEADLQEAQIDRIRETAELERRRFDEIKQAAEGIFDALLTRSRSSGDAILNIFRAAVLTPIKQTFSNLIASLFVGADFGNIFPKFGAFDFRNILRKSGGGLLAAPALGGFGGVPFGPGAPGGTPGFAGPVALGNSGQLSGNLGLLASLKEFAGVGGSVALGAGMATTWQAATLGQKLSAIGHSNAALLGGGLLAYLGLRRGGLSGLAMTTAGGAMIGFKFGGPLGAAIGAGAGAVAGLVRLFVKGPEEKIRDEVRAAYQISIDKQFARFLNEQRGGLDIRTFVRSPQVREQIELYAQMTGQRMGLLDDRPRGVNLVQQSGTVFQDAVWRGNQTFGYSSSLPTLGGMKLELLTAPEPRPTQIVLQLDGQATTELMEGRAVKVIASQPRLVETSYAQAIRSSAGRRQASVNVLNPLETVAV